MGKSKRPMMFALAVVLVVALGIAGTIAYLTDRTDTVTNTFTVGDININLTETDATDPDEDGTWTKEYKMVPGTVLDKDPLVTVEGNSEKCFLFVQVKEDIAEGLVFGDYLEYTIADDWNLLGAANGVTTYYQVVEAADTDQEFNVIKDNKVTVKTTVTKEMMEALAGKKLPTLGFKAFAVQWDNIEEVDKAWEQVPASAKL